jgi:hypothetical protein
MPRRCAARVSVYDNTAIIVETGQSADATALVNVRCEILDGGKDRRDLL